VNPVWWLAAWAGSTFVSCGVVGWVSYWAGFDRGADDEQGRHRAKVSGVHPAGKKLPGAVAGRLAIEPPPFTVTATEGLTGPAEYALLTGRYVLRPDPNAGLLAALADLDAVVAEARELERQWAGLGREAR
jgi:hypothetical protein